MRFGWRGCSWAVIACFLAPAAPAAPDKAGGDARGQRPRTRPPESAPALLWNTFLGGPAADGSRTTNVGRGIAVDGAGNVYMVGTSKAAWGSPVRPFTVGFEGFQEMAVAGGEGVEAFVARLDAGGALVWSTFLGGPGVDYGQAIALDGSGNLYVAGMSSAAWGRPVRSYTEGRDAFVARLDAKTGALAWNTFLGGAEARAEGSGIAVDGSGDVYVTGRSDAAWGRPVRAYTAGHDAFAAKLEAKTGALVWNTFLGGSGSDEGNGVAVGGGNLYVVGSSADTWGKPVRAHTTRDDAFAAKLDAASGALLWNTFLGGSGSDHGRGVAVDGSGRVYVAGESTAAWGSPVRAYTADYDAFVARLDPASGAVVWHTFLGGPGLDEGLGIAVDGSGNVYLAGASDAPWGSPVQKYSALTDAFAARLDASGAVAWTTFLGGAHQDFAKSIALDGSGNIYLAGWSSGTWGTPVRAHPGGGEGAFAAKLGAAGGARDGKH
jgi:DNA-binding beta-propeller fold protein YncE